MTRPAIHWMNLGPWPGYVGFTVDETAFQREMKRLGIKNVSFVSTHSDASTHFFTSPRGVTTTIICMIRATRRYSKEQYAALLAHEAVHVIQGMRKNLGDLGREAEAYLVQQIVQEGLQQAWGTGRCRKERP